MKLGAIVYEAGDAKAIDALFVSLRAQLKARGCRLAGAVQHNDIGSANACAHMVLEDIVTGRSFDISVPGDKKSDACSLDPAALEDVAGHLASTLHSDIDLVIINRFGKQEALGNGLRSVVESAIAQELPVITALCSVHLASWNAFTGGEDERLPADPEALVAWCYDVCRQPA